MSLFKKMRAVFHDDWCSMTEQLSRSRTAMTLRQEMLKQQMTLTRLQLQKLTQQTRQPRRQTLNNL